MYGSQDKGALDASDSRVPCPAHTTHVRFRDPR